jgi:hypothetical protein
VNEVQDRIDDFERAQQAVERARGALVNAEVELGNAKTRLDASRDRLFEECPELRPAGIPDAEPAEGNEAFEVVEVDDEDVAARLRLQPENWREKAAARRGAPSASRGEAGDN